MRSALRGRRFVGAALVAAFVLSGGCGSDSTGPDPDPTPDPSQSSMSAKIDGQQWTANVGVHAVRASGAVGIAGGDGTLLISLGFVGGTGTFTIGGASGANGTVSEANGARAWSTATGPGGSGSITVTSIDDTRVVGTFSFVAPATSSTGATGTRTVTEGTFNVRF